MSERSWVIAVIVLLLVLNVMVWAWALIARNSLSTCQSSEREACPSYYCPNPSNYCTDPNTGQPSPNAPFRLRGTSNVYQCQNYTIRPTLTSSQHGCGPISQGYMVPC